MTKQQHDNFTLKPFGRMLYRTVCILLALTVLTAWSVSGVYARYVTSATTGGTAGVANMGIDTFELKEHAVLDFDDVDPDDLDAMLKDMVAANNLHILDTSKEVVSNDTLSVPRGYVNVPRDPFIRLEINSEVSYELYLKVTEVNESEADVTYSLASHWIATNTDGLYKYSTDGSNAFVFRAGTQYIFDNTSTDSNAQELIKVLADDKIVVKLEADSATVTITFEAYLKQVL